jgi:nitronate monooxygenase
VTAAALRTGLCERLGITRPVISSGMGGVAMAPLVAAVSNAGGLGVLAGLNVPVDRLEGNIAQVRTATDRPFGVNLWLHTELQPPTDPASIDESTIAAAQTTLNRFRHELGLPAVPTGMRPEPGPDLIAAAIEVILEQRPAVFSIGLGHPGAELVGRCHDEEIAVMAMATTVEDAEVLASEGVDIIVAQGSEAGGHRSTWVKRPPETSSVGTMALVPAVVDAVAHRGSRATSVVAAGGIADGRGLVAALALGAEAVLLGTRFVATRESRAAEFWKDRLVTSHGEDTVVTDRLTGYHARVVANELVARHEGPVLPSLLQARLAADLYAAGHPEYFPMHAGQSVDLIRDLPGAAEVVERICAEAEAVLAGLR